MIYGDTAISHHKRVTSRRPGSGKRRDEENEKRRARKPGEERKGGGGGKKCPTRHLSWNPSALSIAPSPPIRADFRVITLHFARKPRAHLNRALLARRAMSMKRVRFN